jgi:hypothetical protein
MFHFASFRFVLSIQTEPKYSKRIVHVSKIKIINIISLKEISDQIHKIQIYFRSIYSFIFLSSSLWLEFHF